MKLIKDDELHQKFYEKLKNCTPNFIGAGVPKKLDYEFIERNFFGELLLMSDISHDTIKKIHEDKSLRICCISDCRALAYVKGGDFIMDELSLDEIRDYVTEDEALGKLDFGGEVLFCGEFEVDDVYNLHLGYVEITLYQDIKDWFIDVIKEFEEFDPEILEEFSSDSNLICPNELVHEFIIGQTCGNAYHIDEGGIQDERSINLGFTTDYDIAITSYRDMNDDDWFGGNVLRFFRKV